MKKRISIFNQIHRALRAMLYECALRLQLTDFSSAEETAESLAQLEVVLRIFTLHSEAEDKFIFPAVHAYDQLLVKEFDRDHEKDEFLIHRIEGLIRGYHQSFTDELRSDKGEVIIRTFNEFIAFNLYHMNKEEEQLNPVLWENYTDEEIKSIQQAIIKSIPEQDGMICCQWLLKGNSDADVVNWLRDIKNTAPCFVLESLMTLAEEILPRVRWAKVQEGLTEGLQIA